MNNRSKKGRKYSIRKILIAVGILLLTIVLIVKVLTPTPKGKTKDMVPIPVLTKDENRALCRYINDHHREVAKEKGLKAPVKSKEEHQADAKAFSSRYNLQEITDNKYYEIPHLTNSTPYLRPAAKDFLDLLGENFCDRPEALGMTEYRFSVTSILRTIEDEKSLRKNNVNATANNSSHY
ncbi:MAG: hypothetical protein ACJA08_001488 [Cyclobacteriaceae bacterium]|jgi:hypothetical protein